MAVAWAPQGPIKVNTQAGNPRKDKPYYEEQRPGGKWHIYAGGPRLKVTPKAPAPSAPVAPTPASLLPDSQYTAETGLNQAQYAQTLNALVGQETRLGLDAGVDISRNADGTIAGYGFSADISNPYSQAALLKRAYDVQQRGATNSYAARGQLYSGALQNAQAANAFEFERGRDSLLKQFQDNLLRISSERTTAQNQLSAGNLDALAGLLDRRAQTAPVDPGPAPKAGFPFVAKSGPRAGMGYKIIKRKSGNIRRFEDGYEEPQ